MIETPESKKAMAIWELKGPEYQKLILDRICGDANHKLYVMSSKPWELDEVWDEVKKSFINAKYEHLSKDYINDWFLGYHSKHDYGRCFSFSFDIDGTEKSKADTFVLPIVEKYQDIDYYWLSYQYFLGNEAFLITRVGNDRRRIQIDPIVWRLIWKMALGNNWLGPM